MPETIPTTRQLVPLERTAFHNSFVEALPGDQSGDNRPRQVPGVCWSAVTPTPVRNPRLLAWSEDLGAYLGLAQPGERDPAVDLLAGNAVAPTMKPFAARYGGHQFGSWAGQLGDGRAISLGEVTATDGSSWEIQLKGAGPTPYSRRADGRAVLRSSLREFLCSEAMHSLGVPTTRALSLVATGDTVVRDMFYSGDPKGEPGAIVARVAPTFVRFGSFQILAALNETDNLRKLADYVIRHHYPELGSPSPEVYALWFEQICFRTAAMIADWMTVGFVHGVMNTDNMSILGVTIDYGPYGWLEPFDPDWTPNTTDFSQHRYAFGQQPQVALWNLQMLAQALTPLLPDPNDLVRGLESFGSAFNSAYLGMLVQKVGLARTGTFAPETDESDRDFLQSLHQALYDSEMDMTLFFRQLSHTAGDLLTDPTRDDARFRELIDAASYAPAAAHESLLTWLSQYAARLRHAFHAIDSEEVTAAMLRVNPKYVLRNYLAQNAIEAAENGDLTVLNRLLTVLKNPYDEQPEHDELAAKRPAWAQNKPGCATLSCSS